MGKVGNKHIEILRFVLNEQTLWTHWQGKYLFFRNILWLPIQPLNNLFSQDERPSRTRRRTVRNRVKEGPRSDSENMGLGKRSAISDYESLSPERLPVMGHTQRQSILKMCKCAKINRIERIILGGKLMRKWQSFFRAIRQAINEMDMMMSCRHLNSGWRILFKWLRYRRHVQIAVDLVNIYDPDFLRYYCLLLLT